MQLIDKKVKEITCDEANSHLHLFYLIYSHLNILLRDVFIEPK